MKRVILAALVSAMFGLVSLAGCNECNKCGQPCETCPPGTVQQAPATK